MYRATNHLPLTSIAGTQACAITTKTITKKG
jgi:hypothetical protein